MGRILDGLGTVNHNEREREVIRGGRGGGYNGMEVLFQEKAPAIYLSIHTQTYTLVKPKFR